MTLFLKGVVVRGKADDFNVCCVNLPFLPCAGGFNQTARNSYSRPSSQPLNISIIFQSAVCNNLNAFQAGPVIDLYERKPL